MRDDPRRGHAGAAGARGRSVALAVWLAAAVGAGPPAEKAKANAKANASTPADDLTFRPTVIVRNGNGQGSGTIIASVGGEALILTAAHVVREPGEVGVELHRYNLGVEQALPRGGWPVTIPAEVAAVDPAGDVAVIRVRGRPAFPYVASLGGSGDEPARGALVTSVGVDGGDRLRSWATRVHGVVWFALAPVTDPRAARSPVAAGAQSGRGPTPAPASAASASGTRFFPTARAREDGSLDPGERPYLITARAPEQGRSGGGLFLNDRRLVLVGVCVGRIDVRGGTSIGVFASGESVRRLLRENDLDTLVARSAADRSGGDRLRGDSPGGDRRQETGDRRGRREPNRR